MDNPREASRIIARIAASVMPDLQAKVGEAYLRGFPLMLHYGEEGLNIETIPADQFYSPQARAQMAAGRHYHVGPPSERER